MNDSYEQSERLARRAFHDAREAGFSGVPCASEEGLSWELMRLRAAVDVVQNTLTTIETARRHTLFTDQDEVQGEVTLALREVGLPDTAGLLSQLY